MNAYTIALDAASIPAEFRTCFDAQRAAYLAALE
jgi:hypothetical protein